jgi:hypothetical protein
VKDELLDDVPTRRDCRCGLVAMASPESSDSEELEESEDLGGDSSSVGIWRATRSYGLRVRRIGPLLSIWPLAACPFISSPSFVFFGRVRAQFSHGIALSLSFSSYVFRKLESLLRLFAFCTLCNADTLGLPGGVLIVFEACDLILWLC